MADIVVTGGTVTSAHGDVEVKKKKSSSSRVKSSSGGSSGSSGSVVPPFLRTETSMSVPGGYVTSSGQFTTDASVARSDASRSSSSRTVKAPSAPTIVPDAPSMFGGGVIEPAPERNLFQRVTDPVKGFSQDFGKQFSRSFFLSPDTGSVLRGEGLTTPGQEFGALVGSVGGIASFGEVGGAPEAVAAFRTTKVGSQAGKIFNPISRAGQALERTRLTRFLKDVGVGAAGTQLTAEAFEFGSRKRQLNPLVGSPEVMGAVSSGLMAESEAVAKRGLPSQIIFEASRFKGDEAAFTRVAREELQRQGYSGEGLEKALKAAVSERDISAGRERTSLLTISAFSESIGRKGVSKAFDTAYKKGVKIPKSKSFMKSFGIIAPEIGQAGFIEGSVQTAQQQISRQQERDTQEILAMGGFGAAVAAPFGGSIGGLTISGRKSGKMLEWVANIIDPFEKPGDITADVIEGGVKRAGFGVPTPVFFSVNTDSFNAQSFGGTPKAPSAPTSILPFVPSSTPTPTKSPVSPGAIFSPTPTPVPPVTPVNTVIPPVTPVPVSLQTPIQTTVPILTNTPVTTSVPVVSPFGRVPPPLPLTLGSGGSGGAGSGRGRRKFVNELSYARNMLFGSAGSPVFVTESSGRGKRKKSKKISSKKKKSSPKNPFFDMLPGGSLL